MAKKSGTKSAKSKKKDEGMNVNIKIDDLEKAIKEGKKGHGEKKSKNVCSPGGCGCFAYFLGFIGSAVYYISNATGFWVGVLGFLKALVWPAFLVYELLKLVGA